MTDEPRSSRRSSAAAPVRWLTKSNVVAKWTALGAELPQVPATEFSDAALTLISVFDLISGMGMAKGDMVKNANTVQDAAAAANPGATLQQLIDSECDSAHDERAIKAIAEDGKKVTCALLWLTRALYFILKMLEPLVHSPQKKLGECVMSGYEVSLKPHHNFMASSAFSMGVKAAPSRDVLMRQLADTEAEAMEQINEVLPHVADLLDACRAILIAKSSKHLTAYAADGNAPTKRSAAAGSMGPSPPAGTLSSPSVPPPNAPPIDPPNATWQDSTNDGTDDASISQRSSKSRSESSASKLQPESSRRLSSGASTLRVESSRRLSSGASTMLSAVVLEGHLWKEGSWRARWMRRWFILRSDLTLAYYEHEPGAAGVLGQPRHTPVSLDGASVREPKSRRDAREHVFRVDLIGGEKMILAAESVDQKARWIEAIITHGASQAAEDDSERELGVAESGAAESAARALARPEIQMAAMGREEKIAFARTLKEECTNLYRELGMPEEGRPKAEATVPPPLFTCVFKCLGVELRVMPVARDASNADLV